jgi:hypothetical protein
MLLDFACGNEEDIKAYFEDRKCYGLELVLVDPLIIKPGFGSEKAGLLLEKERVERQLKGLELSPKRLGG